MVEIKEIINGVQITETIDGNIVEKLISHQSKPFLRTTNETDEETYQVLDIVGEIYNTPALATDFRIIDKNGAVFIPADGVELIEYSKKIRVFRPDDDGDNFHIGNITTTSNSLTINLAADNVNWAYIGGSYYEKYYPDTFNFSPVTTGEKILIIYAKPNSQVFHLAQGAESAEAIEPSYTGLFVARLLVTTEGIDIVEATSGFREKAVDNFVIYSLLAGDRVIGIGANMRLKVQSAGAIRIGGFYNEEDKLYNGCPISVRNDTPFPMEFYNAVDASPEFIAINSADLPFSIKPGETANFAYRGGGIVEIIKTGTTGDYIPLTGTEVGKPIVGDLEIQDYNKIISSTGNTHLTLGDGDIFITGNAIDIGGLNDYINITDNGNGIKGNKEFNKQGDRKAFAQLSDVYDTINERTSSVVDKMLHYWDATAGKWFSSGVEWVSDKVLKLKSILFENYTIVQRDAITNLAEGRLIYVNDTTFKGFQVYKNGAWVEIANGKVDKPTTTSDFTAYPYIVGVNDAGNSTRFVAGNFDIISALFDSNLSYAFPNYNVTYSTFRLLQAVAQTGAVASNDSVGKACDYKSNGATLGRQWGNTVLVDFSLGMDLIFNRKFSILTTVTTQRMFIGLAGVTPPVNQELTTMTNVAGVCMIENSNKIWLIYNNQTGSANLFDTGLINDINYAYRLMIYRDGTSYKIKLIREHRMTYAIDIVDHTLSERPGQGVYDVITRPILWCVDNDGIAETIIRDYGFTLMHKGYRN